MHRLIVTSAAYRPARHASPDRISRGRRSDQQAARAPVAAPARRRDRARRRARRQRRARPEVGGPPVYPPQPDGVMNLGCPRDRRAWTAEPGRRAPPPRALHPFLRGPTPHPALAGVRRRPTGLLRCTRRIRSNTPLQALTLLNDLANSSKPRKPSRAGCSPTAPPARRPESRAAFGFRLVTARQPDADRTRALS